MLSRHALFMIFLYTILPADTGACFLVLSEHSLLHAARLLA